MPSQPSAVNSRPTGGDRARSSRGCTDSSSRRRGRSRRAAAVVDEAGHADVDERESAVAAARGCAAMTRPAIENPTQSAANTAKIAWYERPGASSGPRCVDVVQEHAHGLEPHHASRLIRSPSPLSSYATHSAGGLAARARLTVGNFDWRGIGQMEFTEWASAAESRSGPMLRMPDPLPEPADAVHGGDAAAEIRDRAGIPRGGRRRARREGREGRRRGAGRARRGGHDGAGPDARRRREGAHRRRHDRRARGVRGVRGLPGACSSAWAATWPSAPPTSATSRSASSPHLRGVPAPGVPDERHPVRAGRPRPRARRHRAARPRQGARPRHPRRRAHQPHRDPRPLEVDPRDRRRRPERSISPTARS